VRFAFEAATFDPVNGPTCNIVRSFVEASSSSRSPIQKIKAILISSSHLSIDTNARPKWNRFAKSCLGDL